MPQARTHDVMPPSYRGRAATLRSRMTNRPANSGNRAVNFLVALGIWSAIVMATVDFSALFAARGALPQTPTLTAMTPDPTSRAIKILLIVIGLLVLIGRSRMTRQLVRRINASFFALAGLAIASVTWSFDPHATIARFVSFSATMLISIAFCTTGWHRARFQNVVGAAVTAVLVGSLVYIILDPRLAIDPNGAGYHGLSEQKNPFGEVAAVGTLLWMHRWISGEDRSWRAIAGAAVAWTCLYLSRSATSILATLFATFFLVMLMRLPASSRRYTPYITVAFAVLVVLYALAILDIVPGLATLLLRPITAITGKDMTFSERTAIWQIVKAHADLHPLLGTGYGAYWTGAYPGSQSYEVVRKLYYWPSESHNGYLEIYNDLGLVGLIVLLGYLATYIRQSLQLFKFDRIQAALYLALFFQQAFTNLSESGWFSANGVLPVAVMTVATCALGRALLEGRIATPQAAGGRRAKGLPQARIGV